MFRTYIKDRYYLIRILIAKNVSFTKELFFNILLNDHESEIRIALLKRMNYSVAPVSVADCILDRSKKIGEEVFRIYNEFLDKIRITDAISPLKMFDSTDKSIMSYDKSSKLEGSIEEIYERFMNFLRKILRGVS